MDLTTPGENRDKMSGKKLNFQIKKVITLVRKLTWTWQLTSTTHSLQQFALLAIKISQRRLIMISFHRSSIFFSYSLVKNVIFWGFTEPGSILENHHFFHWILVKWKCPNSYSVHRVDPTSPTWKNTVRCQIWRPGVVVRRFWIILYVSSVTYLLLM